MACCNSKPNFNGKKCRCSDINCECREVITEEAYCYPKTRGPQGPAGPRGPRGPRGFQGPEGTCNCQCKQEGEQILNGGMELFTNGIPSCWSTNQPAHISKVNQLGRVHMGKSAVNLKPGTDKLANLSQTIHSVSGGCYYMFSFFARGEGATVNFKAKVNFICESGEVCGGEGEATLVVSEQASSDHQQIYSYYRIMTKKIPLDIIAIEILFEVPGKGQQSLDIDDVSFCVA